MRVGDPVVIPSLDSKASIFPTPPPDSGDGLAAFLSEESRCMEAKWFAILDDHYRSPRARHILRIRREGKLSRMVPNIS